MPLRCFLIALSCIAALAGCERAGNAPTVAFNAIDITGTDYAKEFALTDHTGKPRTIADFKGKIVLLSFGYTHCPDFCPTTLANLAKVVKLMGKDGERVQVLFVTLDPKRDTQQVLAQYVPAFDANFLGLYGDAAAIKKTARAFKIFYEQQKSDTPDSYTVDHTVGTFAFDANGRLRLFIADGITPEKIVADLRLLLG